VSILSRGKGVSLPASLPPLASVSSMLRGVLSVPRFDRGLDEIFDIIDEILKGANQSR